MIVPFVYSFVILFAILNAIREKYKEPSEGEFPVTRLEATALYLATAPWICMTAFAYFHVDQWIEILFTNLGFIVITVILIYRTIARSRRDLKN